MGRDVGRTRVARARVRVYAVSVMLLGLLAACGAGPVWAAQAVLVADAHVNSAMPDANSGAISNLDVGGGYTALLQFDLSMLPAGTTASQVQRAVLRLYANRVTTAGQVSYAPITASWGEYSVTYSTEPSMGAATGTFAVTQAGAFVAVDVTALVQGWITNPATNNGLALTASAAVVQFDSKENDLTAHPATLEVDLANQGPAGPAGPQGVQGIQGPAGVAGAAGAQGPMGPQGLMGAAGAAGATGAQGPMGPAGATGAVGATGPMGPQGPAGATGPAGPQGPAGATGPAGPQGPAGPAGAGGLAFQGSYSSTTNYALGDVVQWQGSSYTSLIAGNHGNEPSASPEQWGLLAAQGAAGVSGATGAAGPQGPQGLPGTQGAVGPPGPQGAQGVAGQAGAQGIPGATGATGPSGPMGPQGPAGPVGITFQGEYLSTTNYALADGVQYKGSGYVSLVANNHGNTPDQSPQQWALFAAVGAVGATGPAGAVGATGLMGPQGPQGIAGVTGATGTTGPQGPPVANYLGNYQSSTNYTFADAVSWQGSTYISLTSGNHGNTPDQNPAYWAVLAAQGAAGAAGAAGATGPMGPEGPAGVTGAAGPQGPPVTFRSKWLVGTAYVVGDAVSYGGSSYIALAANAGREPDASPVYWGVLAEAGAAGPAGATGATGPQGPSGYAGPAGATGPQGPAGPTGPQGPQGPTGQTGAQGPPGATGAAGATGATGLPGANGTNGINGAAGPAGMTFRGAWLNGYGYAANDAVSYGNPASTYIALAANSSSEPDLYPQVWAVLAQAGSVGPSGPTGVAATVAVGTVTTGAAGTQAVVTNSGTSTAAVLNFTIPQGATGPAGTGGSGASGSSASVYHVEPSGGSPGVTLEYYSVSVSQSGPAEAGEVLTWMPNGCTVSALSVYSQLTAQTTLTLRSLPSPTGTASTLLSCTLAAGPSSTTCSIPSGTQVAAGSFIDLGIVSQSGPTNPGIWTALACN